MAQNDEGAIEIGAAALDNPEGILDLIKEPVEEARQKVNAGIDVTGTREFAGDPEPERDLIAEAEAAAERGDVEASNRLYAEAAEQFAKTPAGQRVQARAEARERSATAAEQHAAAQEARVREAFLDKVEETFEEIGVDFDPETFEEYWTEDGIVLAGSLIAAGVDPTEHGIPEEVAEIAALRIASILQAEEEVVFEQSASAADEKFMQLLGQHGGPTVPDDVVKRFEKGEGAPSSFILGTEPGKVNPDKAAEAFQLLVSAGNLPETPEQAEHLVEASWKLAGSYAAAERAAIRQTEVLNAHADEAGVGRDGRDSFGNVVMIKFNTPRGQVEIPARSEVPVEFFFSPEDALADSVFGPAPRTIRQLAESDNPADRRKAGTMAAAQAERMAEESGVFGVLDEKTGTRRQVKQQGNPLGVSDEYYRTLQGGERARQKQVEEQIRGRR